MEFQGKTALVTGAAGGMGLAIARGLLARGASVGMLDLKPKPTDIDDDSSSAFFQGDIADPVFVQTSIDELFRQSRRLDYLVNAAGVLWFGRDCSAVDVDLTVWQKVIDINLTGMVHTARASVPLMQRGGGGAMVHFSSTQCLRGDDKPQDAYQASKAAMIALSKSLAIQFAGVGIRSNVIVPGPTESPMQARWQEDAGLREATAACVPLRRVGTPQDMANATLFLLSEKASFITGTELLVDGGLLARP